MQRGRTAARPGRSRTALYTWGAVALVIIIVVVIVVVSSTSSPKSNVVFQPKPVPAKILSEVTHVPTKVFNGVGTGITGVNNPPSVVTGQPALTVGGKPEAFAMLGEFCPYCAAERWSIITSLSRFGTFSGVKTMQSSTTDIYPATQTFTFDTSTYKSPYFVAKLLEIYGQDKATGNHPVLHKPTKAETKLVLKYDKAPTGSSSGTIPFFDIGNKVFFSGSSYSPSVLQGLSRGTIAASLKDAKNPITKLIIGASNYISAGICAIDGGKPGAVCSSPGVQAAAKALKLSV